MGGAYADISDIASLRAGCRDMSTIMIKCPQTGQAVSTGIEVEHDTFITLPDADVQMHCPACGGEHIWSKAKAWLADGNIDNGKRPA